MRVAIFIDGNNIFHSARSAGVEIDYSKLLGLLTGEDELVRVTFYTGVDENEKQRGFLHWMRRNGFKVVTKAVKTDSEGVRKAKIKIEITTDMMVLSEYCEKIVVVSGDEDFAYPCKTLMNRGVRLMIAGFRQSLSNILMDSCDQIFELDGYIDEFRKSDEAE